MTCFASCSCHRPTTPTSRVTSVSSRLKLSYHGTTWRKDISAPRKISFGAVVSVSVSASDSRHQGRWFTTFLSHSVVYIEKTLSLSPPPPPPPPLLPLPLSHSPSLPLSLSPSLSLSLPLSGPRFTSLQYHNIQCRNLEWEVHETMTEGGHGFYTAWCCV